MSEIKEIEKKRAEMIENIEEKRDNNTLIFFTPTFQKEGKWLNSMNSGIVKVSKSIKLYTSFLSFSIYIICPIEETAF